MQNVLNNLSQLPVYVYVIFAVMFIYTIVVVVFTAKGKKKFFTDNPDAATVNFEQKPGLKSISIYAKVLTENKEELKKIKYLGFKMFIVPGTYTLEATCTRQRPGVMYKTVTETFGPSKVEITVEPKKEYVLGWDKTAKDFTFTEKIAK